MVKDFTITKTILNTHLLKYPFHAEARATLESGNRTEVVAQLHFRSQIEVVNAEMSSDIIPQLGFADENGVLER